MGEKKKRTKCTVRGSLFFFCLFVFVCVCNRAVVGCSAGQKRSLGAPQSNGQRQSRKGTARSHNISTTFRPTVASGPWNASRHGSIFFFFCPAPVGCRCVPRASRTQRKAKRAAGERITKAHGACNKNIYIYMYVNKQQKKKISNDSAVLLHGCMHTKKRGSGVRVRGGEKERA